MGKLLPDAVFFGKALVPVQSKKVKVIKEREDYASELRVSVQQRMALLSGLPTRSLCLFF